MLLVIMSEMSSTLTIKQTEKTGVCERGLYLPFLNKM